MGKLVSSILLTLTLSTGCSDSAPKVVTKVERVYPAPPPAGACEPQATPAVAGVMDWKTRAVIYAEGVLRRDNTLARCQEWLMGWQAERDAKPVRP